MDSGISYSSNDDDAYVDLEIDEIMGHDILKRHLEANTHNLDAMIYNNEYICACRISEEWDEDINVDDPTIDLNISSKGLNLDELEKNIFF